MYKIDLNSDLGESFGNYKLAMDKEIIPLISILLLFRFGTFYFLSIRAINKYNRITSLNYFNILKYNVQSRIILFAHRISY